MASSRGSPGMMVGGSHMLWRHSAKLVPSDTGPGSQVSFNLWVYHVKNVEEIFQNVRNPLF